MLNPTRWIQEHHLDWYLIYRSRQELLEIGRRAAPDAEHQQVQAARPARGRA